METLKDKIIIKQEVEPLEIFTGLETGNKYSILDENKNKLYYAYEDNTSFIVKQILGSHRKVNLKVLDNSKTEALSIERPFFLLNCNATVKLSNGKILGYIKQTKWLGNKTFEFLGPDKKKIFTCKCKIPKIWTFNIFIDDEQVGQILKKWSGSGREFFTDSDTFFVDFEKIKDDTLRHAVLAMAFIIDLRAFEVKS